MKKFFVLLAIVTLLLPSCQKINDRIDGLEDRIDQIEGTQIATINQQIEAINSTLPQLRETDAELKEYIKSLQTTATNLQEQITNTNDDIDELEDALDQAIADAEASNDALKTELVTQLNAAKADILAQLESTKTALEAELNQINSTIATLQAKDAELEGKITTLEEYVNTELQNTEDWATATFATLEQYNTIVEDIATIKTQIEALNTSLTNLEERLNTKIATDIAAAVEGLQSELATKVTEITTAYTTAISRAKEEITTAYTEAIAAAITNLESSMKEWVNEQLTGYYTIAEIDATLNALQKSLDESNEALANDITELSEKVDAMKAELTEAYNSAIDEAISTNNGIIDSKIEGSIAEVNGRIDSEVATINARISALEERIDSLEDAIDEIKALDIIFDIENGVACMAGASIEFGYTVIGGDNDTVVECFGDGGWSADVISSASTGGRIQVTAPSFGGKGKVVVLATSGAGGTCMKSIRFDEGILTDILDTYEVDFEACTLNVTLKTNLDYNLNIPSDIDWLSVVDTRAEVREDLLTFSITENLIAEPRSATLALTDKAGNSLHSFIISQKPQPVIEFADPIVKKVCVTKFDANEDGEITFYEASTITKIESNFFDNYSHKVTSFDELQYFKNIYSIEGWAFDSCSNLTHITIPESVTSIGEGAFMHCSSLARVNIPEGIYCINYGTFCGCSNLTKINIPQNVYLIDQQAFFECTGLTRITIPESVDFISASAFMRCSGLREFNGKFASGDGRCLVIDDTLIAFAPTEITEYTIPNDVIKIGAWVFENCSNLTSIIMPESLEIIEEYAFYGCSSLTNITIPKGVTSIECYAFSSCICLESVTISESVESIGDGTFYWCENLKDVYCKAIIPPTTTLGEWGNWYTFYGCSDELTVYVPMESVEAYKTAEGWSQYADQIVSFDFENGVVAE